MGENAEISQKTEPVFLNSLLSNINNTSRPECSEGGQGRSQVGAREGAVAPNCLQNRTCKKFKSGEILRWGGGREAGSGTFLRYNQD